MKINTGILFFSFFVNMKLEDKKFDGTSSLRDSQVVLLLIHVVVAVSFLPKYWPMDSSSNISQSLVAEILLKLESDVMLAGESDLDNLRGRSGK